MPSTLKNALKYVIMLSVTIFLLWLSFQNIKVSDDQSKWDFIIKTWKSANKYLLALSAVTALLSHLLRAERWKLLLLPLGHKVTLGESFMSVMVGYFINLAIPRGGELSRCYNLYRLNKIPVEVSFGTVVVERIIDLILLIILLTAAFFVELDNLLHFFRSDQIKTLTSSGRDSPFSYTLLAGVIIFFIGFFMIIRYIFRRKRYLALRYLSKIKKMASGLKSGITSIFKLEKRTLFFLYSVLIWLCYYLMMYLVMLAFPETAHLGFLGALTIFVIGGIAMAVPLPGGAGSFHILVPLGLVILYSIPEGKAVPFTFIFHGWQTLIIIIVGALSLFLSQLSGKKIEGDKK